MQKLWSHQQKALEIAGDKFALFFDPGTGKSRTALELLKRANKSGWVRKIIIIAPLNVVRNWEDEIVTYFNAPYKTFLIGGQTKDKKIKILKEFAAAKVQQHNLFLIINIAVLQSEPFVNIMLESKTDFIIVDESHNFKTYNSSQTKGLLRLCKGLSVKYLYLLTGTPAPNGEMDLWSTFYLLDKTKDTFFVWRKKHFEDKNERRRGMNSYWPEYVVKESSKKAFAEVLATCSLSAHKNEVLDLPELLRTNIYCEMSKEQARHYETMLEYLFAIDKDGNELDASNVLVRTLRLQQIIAGFLGNEPIKGNNRIKALQEAINLTQGEQFLIWTIFRATYRSISECLDDLGITHRFLTGDQTAEERYENMNLFQSGTVKALIAHPKAGGVGVNLTAASYSIHYSKSFSLTDDLQAEARNYRGGSERHNRITRIDIITPKTVDEQITIALREKKSVQDFILGLKENR